MSESPVGIFLKNTNVLDRFASISRILFGGLMFLIVLALVAIALDAALALNSWLRILVDVVVILSGIYVALILVRMSAKKRFESHRVARQVENEMLIEHNQLVNAIDLSDSANEFTSESLRKTAVAKANELSRELSPFSAVKFGPAILAFLSAMLAVGFAVAIYVAAPKMVSRVLPRFLDPMGNHPAFTSLQFEITVNPEVVVQGDDIIVQAKLDGAYLPDTANLFIVDHEGNEFTYPMQRFSSDHFSVQLENLQTDLRCRIETANGMSDEFSIAVKLVPQFEKVWIEFTYPAYTGWETQRRLLDQRGIQGLVGTRVELEIESNLLLANGLLKLSKEKSNTQVNLEPFRKHPTESEQENSAAKSVQGEFELLDQTGFSLSLLAKNGVNSSNDVSGRIIAVPDRVPQIQILAPESLVLAVEGWKVPVKIQAIDDVGLGRIEIFPSVNGFGPYPKVLSETSRETSAVVDYEFDLEQLGAKAGDVINYFASTTDNYPIELPGSEDHLAKTEMYTIQVISLEEYQEMARHNYRMDDINREFSELQNMLAELKEKRNSIVEQSKQLEKKLESGEQLTAAEQELLEQLQKQLEEFAKQAQELGDQLEERAEQPSIYDFEDSYKEMLKDLAEKLSAQSNDANRLNEAMKAQQAMQNSAAESMSAEELIKALEQFQNNDQPFDQQSEQQQADMREDMNKLGQAEELLQQIGNMRQIIKRQRQIADELAEFRNQENTDETLSDEQQRRMRKLAKEQDLLKQELQQTIESMEKAADANEQTFPKASQSVRDMAQSIRDAGIMDDQNNAASSARESDGKSAYEAAEQAANKLEAMQCDCNGNSMSQEMQADAPLTIPKQQMSNSLKQLAQSMPIPGMKTGKKGKGAGTRGSMSQATLFGPHQPSNNRSEARRGFQQNNQDGKGLGFDSAGAFGDPESLTPEAREGSRDSRSNLRGVPSHYIDHAKAYMKRLNETDNNKESDKNSETDKNR